MKSLGKTFLKVFILLVQIILQLYYSFYSAAAILFESGLTCLPRLNVLEDLVCSFALVQPGVSAVPHQLTPFHPSLHQEALEGIIAQKPEFL